MFELSGVNYEEVLEQGDSILVRVSSSYRGFELSGLYCIYIAIRACVRSSIFPCMCVRACGHSYARVCACVQSSISPCMCECFPTHRYMYIG